jgi:hypothetical protein
MKKWERNHNGNIIRVENSVNGERLYVNDELQDEQCGFAIRARLWGQLPTGESIKVSLGGWWTMQCRIFVDHKQVFPERTK